MHPRAEHVAAALAEAGADPEIRELDGSARTAAEAATTLGTEVGAIANSLVFIADGAPLLVLASGGHWVNTDALAPRIGVAAIERAGAEQVLEATGQKIGGVAPLGHPTPLRTVIDPALRAFDPLWAAAGHPRTVFRIGFEELRRVTGAEVIEID